MPFTCRFAIAAAAPPCPADARTGRSTYPRRVGRIAIQWLTALSEPLRRRPVANPSLPDARGAWGLQLHPPHIAPGEPLTPSPSRRCGWRGVADIDRLRGGLFLTAFARRWRLVCRTEARTWPTPMGMAGRPAPRSFRLARRHAPDHHSMRRGRGFSISRSIHSATLGALWRQAPRWRDSAMEPQTSNSMCSRGASILGHHRTLGPVLRHGRPYHEGVNQYSLVAFSHLRSRLSAG